MATTLTAIAPQLYGAAQEVSAEPSGMAQAVSMDFDNKGVAYGDNIKVPIVPAQSAGNFTPGAYAPTGTGAGTAEAVSVSISKQREVSMILTAEHRRSLENGGNYAEWVRQWGAQAMRTLRNEMEIDLCTAAKVGASRAIGTAGTTPFAAALSDLSNVRKILRDNGAPMADLQFVGNTSTELNLLNLGVVQQAYAAGSDAERRAGVIGKQLGFMMRTSAGISTHTKGTATGFDANGGEPVGETTIVVDGSDSGTILAGDVVTWAGDANKYIVASATASGAADGNIVINKPGLISALDDTVEGTIGDSYTPNFAFERSAIVGVVRPPLLDPSATIRTMPISDGNGMTYLFVEATQWGQTSWYIMLSWGFKVVQPEHVAILLG